MKRPKAQTLISLTRAGLILCALSGPVWSENSPQSVTPRPYDDLARTLSGRFDFEGFPLLPEPGAAYDHILTAPSARLGERLSGQQVQAVDGGDHLAGAPRLPLGVATGRPGENLAVSYHAGFGSNALFPLGPDGFARISGRGEGSIALVFDHDINRFALKLHADYADPLGSRPSPGPITLTFYDRMGQIIGQVTETPTTGVAQFGYQITPPARAVTLTHKDPGGIAVDDILYPLDTHTS